MTRIKIVTDSSTDLPRKLIEKHGVYEIPIIVRFGEEEYRSGVDITTSEFYAKMNEHDVFPTTAQITPGEFTNVYQELADEADVIISIHLSGKMSGIMDSARLAAQNMENVKVIVYDSESASFGVGFLVLEAIKAVEENCAVQEITRRLDQVKESMRVYFSVPSLEHLQKGGRIGKAAAFLGGLLNIIPLLTIEGGYVSPFEKIRGKKRILKKMVQQLNSGLEELGGKDQITLGILHAENEEGYKELVQKIREELGIEDFLFNEVGPIIGTHSGPGILAIFFHKKTG
ncbi:MAG: DegV family protein [Halanaerobiales bacterium]|nr:DegV family protein [Halanaerobiales bacterium]